MKRSLRRAVAGLVVVTQLAGCATSGKPIPATGEVPCDREVGVAQGAKAGAAAGVAGFRNSLGVSSCSDLAGCGLIALLLPIFVAGGAIAGAVATIARDDSRKQTCQVPPPPALGPPLAG